MLLVVLGAGASHDSVDPLTDDTNDLAKRQPLTRELFDARFDHHASGLPYLKGGLHEMRRAIANEESIEDAMQRFRDEARPDDRRRLMELMALRFYIHRVIDSCSRNWAQRGISNYRLMLDRLRVRRDTPPTLLVTFNYDCMIERAMYDVFDIEIERFSDYLADDRLRLWKLHGSVNWRRTASPAKEYPKGEDPLPVFIEHAPDVRIDRDGLRFGDSGLLVDTDESSRYAVVTGRAAVPALALPFKEKAEFECPPDHVARLKNDLPKVTQVVAIGWRAAEEPFRDMLGSVPSHVPVLVVGNSVVGVGETVERLRAAGLQNLHSTHEGFTGFLRRRGFDEFLDGDLSGLTAAAPAGPEAS